MKKVLYRYQLIGCDVGKLGVEFVRHFYRFAHTPSDELNILLELFIRQIAPEFMVPHILHEDGQARSNPSQTAVNSECEISFHLTAPSVSSSLIVTDFQIGTLSFLRTVFYSLAFREAAFEQPVIADWACCEITEIG